MQTRPHHTARHAVLFAIPLLVALILPLLRSAARAGTELHDHATYIPVKADDWITAEWTASEGAEEYEFRLKSYERNSYVTFPASSARSINFQLPKSGHYVAQVRACRGAGAVRECSEWAESTSIDNHPQVKQPDGTLYERTWWMYQYLRPIGGEITITK